ncbi:molybdenum cofactor sulfurase [Selaginella moellendorffii]|nr:molybdenum cofactor sulfurase [Selaginella moellendorffii]|eukprot:XP_002976941.2 molybdenum cofactor sulfurase [Selaginella moellendorffii]
MLQRERRDPSMGLVWEDLPDLHSAQAAFLELYPEYQATCAIDSLRRTEYPHLDEDRHACFDYGGIGIFSSREHQNFALAYAPTSLVSHALYEDSRSIEGTMRARILAHLGLDERDYSIVFAADSCSALRLLVDSFHFGRILLGYDFKNEGLSRIEESARATGAKVVHATLSSTGFGIDRRSLQRKLKKHKREFKGLFAYPIVSRVTGTKNSVEWIKEARDNGWCVLLDVSGIGAASSSMDLAGLSPDFLVGSFYKVFGMDPTGFGCLVVKKSMLGDCSGGRAAGMVKVVKAHSSFLQIPESFKQKSESYDAAASLSSRKDNGMNPQRRLEVAKPKPLKESVSPSVKLTRSSEFQATRYYYSTSRASSFHGLHHAEKLAELASMRQDSLLGWLRASLLLLRHPSPGRPGLVTFHSPEDSGPALAFSLSDNSGEFLDPELVQRLANRSNISLGTGAIQARPAAMEENSYFCVRKLEASSSSVQSVLCATLGLVTTFGDVFQLWEFVAQFLDPGFCSRELLQYQGLDQETVFL